MRARLTTSVCMTPARPARGGPRSAGPCSERRADGPRGDGPRSDAAVGAAVEGVAGQAGHGAQTEHGEELDAVVHVVGAAGDDADGATTVDLAGRGLVLQHFREPGLAGGGG